MNPIINEQVSMRLTVNDQVLLQPTVTDTPHEASNMIDILRWRAAHQPAHTAFTFLADGETDEHHMTFGALDLQARMIAATLQSMQATGTRALLVYPSGLEYIAALFGCLYAGVVAVPTCPPLFKSHLSRFMAMMADAQADIILTTTSIKSDMEHLIGEGERQNFRWLTTDLLASESAGQWHHSAVAEDELAVLQYTSGSTRTPRGVMLSHANILSNQRVLHQASWHTEDAVLVSWLPFYHDMGLISMIFHPVYIGMRCILMDPFRFLQKPLRWLSAISRYKATLSGGTNFAYDLCVRRISPEERATLDLSTWEATYVGAEPIHAEMMDRFTAAFEPCGFQRNVFCPGYGLAEATLMVTGTDKGVMPVVQAVDGKALEQNQVVPTDADRPGRRNLVGCGRRLQDPHVVIVDPVSRVPCSSGHIGEIWVRGTGVARGYWNRPEETEETFGAYVAGSGEGPFLRTGDLGFLLDGELFITGRRKDLIIIQGHNYYPQDIEWTMAESHPALQPSGSAAFSVEVESQERLVVVQELEDAQADMDEVFKAIRKTVVEEYGLAVYTAVLVKTGVIPRTSSRKIQRSACRSLFQENKLNAVKIWRETDTGLSSLRSKLKMRAKLLKLISETLEVEPQTIASASRLTDLGVESIQVLRLIVAIEQEFNVVIKPERLHEIDSLAGLTDLIRALQQEQI